MIVDPSGFWPMLDPSLADARFEAWKKSLFAPKPTADRWLAARRLVAMDFPCTGISASWCPNCDSCICDREEGMNDPDCPLHASDSPHATGTVE